MAEVVAVRTNISEQAAIEQRLRWEIEYFGEFAPQIEIIKEQYPHLLTEALKCL